MICSPRQSLDNAIARYTSHLSQIEAKAGHTSDFELFQELDKATSDVLGSCAEYELSATSDEIHTACMDFHQRTEKWLSQSAAVIHTRTWPCGYQGDYKILELMYLGLPSPESKTVFGAIVDSFMLSCTMVIAARGRKAHLCNILSHELYAREGSAQILSIACGSCRDVFDISAEIQRTKSHITCVDRDQDALTYAKRLLLGSGISPDLLTFKQMNALRLVSLKEANHHFGPQDIIYSVGFLDYLDDDRVVRLLRTWYQLLKPGGVLVVAMKDLTRFEPYLYRWLINWTLFQGRTEEKMMSIFDAANIPKASIQTSREPSGVIVFWRAVRQE